MYFSNSETTSSFAARSATSSSASSFSCRPTRRETSFTELSNSGSMQRQGHHHPSLTVAHASGGTFFYRDRILPIRVENREGGRPHVLDLLHDGLGEGRAGQLHQALHAMRQDDEYRRDGHRSQGTRLRGSRMSQLQEASVGEEGLVRGRLAAPRGTTTRLSKQHTCTGSKGTWHSANRSIPSSLWPDGAS